MFDKNKFAQTIKSIKETYNSQEEFSEKSGIGRTYLSQYMNMKLEKPPTPRILEKLAKSSKGLVSYAELMHICGYIDKNADPYIQNVNLRIGYLEDNEDFLKKIGLTDKQIWEFQMMCCSDLRDPKVQNMLKKFFNQLSSQQTCSLLNYIRKMQSEVAETEQMKDKYFKLSNHTMSNGSLHMCPVYGQISAGQPNWAEECLEGYLPIDPNLMGIISPEQCFFLRVKGESMNQLIKNGAYALIRKQDVVENGEVAVVLVNGDEATLKKFTQHGDVIVLEPMSDDPSFQTQVYDKNTRIQILGKYIGKFEMKQ